MTYRGRVAMKSKRIPAVVIVVVSLAVAVLAVLGGRAISAQDTGQAKYTVRVPNGLAFSEFRGYEGWQTVSISQSEKAMAVILANPVMINAYQAGIPGNGKPFPDGSKISIGSRNRAQCALPGGGAGHSDRPYNKNLSTMKAPTEADAFRGEGRPLLGSTQSLGYPSRIPKKALSRSPVAKPPSQRRGFEAS